MNIETLEALAWSEDRTLALKQLIPGSEEYYLYHCLHKQTTGQLEEVDELLGAWITRYGRTDPAQQIERRQLILRAGKDPDAATEHLRQALSLHFDHEREAPDQKRSYPTALDPALLSRDRLATMAFRQAGDLSGFRDRTLGWLIGLRLASKQRRHLLERLRWPDYPGLVELICADLQDPQSAGFGSLPIHLMLLPEQVSELIERMPSMAEDPKVVALRLRHLRPGPDRDWREDAKECERYLTALFAAIEPLPPIYNSLKAQVLYHRLDFDRSHGLYDRARFLSYLSLPRMSSVAAPVRLRGLDRRHVADLSTNHREDTGLPPVRDDEPLVRDYLLHFLAADADTSAFDGLVRPELLREVFVSAKLFAGIGAPETWHTLLDDPDKYQALCERVDIDLSPQNPKRVSTSDTITIAADVKNVSTLVVKVFEINALSYFLTQKRDIDTSIDLDGLVPTYEHSFQYSEPRTQRVRRTFSFPELSAPGIYVIELIGGGKSSRALIRKGNLRYVERLGAAGHVLTIFDEDNHPRPDASIWLAGREYKSREEDGAIILPYTTKPGRQTIILAHGGLATLASFAHQAERYYLSAGIYVDREQLIAGAEAAVVVRPLLTLSGARVPVKLLTETTLILTTEDHLGISSRTEVPIELFDDLETVHRFRLPRALARIDFTLRGKVRSISEQRDDELSSQITYTVNQIDTKALAADLHLSKIQTGYILSYLGKTGEPRADQPIRVVLHHRDFAKPFELMLQTDERGRIALGEIADIQAIQANAPGSDAKRWQLGTDAIRFSRTIHAVEGEDIAIPYMQEGDEVRRVSLLEVHQGRAGTDITRTDFVRQVSHRVLVDQSHITIRGLEPGDYLLSVLPDSLLITIRVTAGKRHGTWALGSARLLETRPQPVQITDLALTENADGQGELIIRISPPAAGGRTRVHVCTSRYVPAHSLMARLGLGAPPDPDMVAVSRARSHYLSGRDIGDEYRYILDRRQAERLPGNLLNRPSVLVNPFALRTTETGVQEAAEGEAYGRLVGAPAQQAALRPPAPRQAPPSLGDPSSLDFLPEPARMLCNLRPDAEGILRIPRSALGQTQLIRVLAVDDTSAAYRQIPLAELEHSYRDLRQAQVPGASAHLAEKRRISTLKAGQTLHVGRAESSAMARYDTIADAYRLLMALSPSDTLAKFGFIRRWHELGEGEKQALFSEHACHELSFYLSRKDPAFFAQVVVPHIAHKVEKTFLDHYLLGHDLRSYLAPWAYGRLNVVERILLMGKTADRRGAQHVRDLYELTAPDPDRDSYLFETALGGNETALTGNTPAPPSGTISSEFAPPPAMSEAADDAMLGMRPRPKRRSTAPIIPPAKAMRHMTLGAPAAAAPAAPPAAGGLPADVAAGAEDEPTATRAFSLADHETMDLASRSKAEIRPLYRGADKTKEWAENHYYELRLSEQGPDLVTVNRFWRDFAEHVAGGADALFISPHIAHAAGGFTEMMLALAVLDLPFVAGAHHVTLSAGRADITAAAPTIIFHKELEPAARRDGAPPILIHQNYLRSDERNEHVGNQRIDKYITGDLVIHTVYIAQVAITNPTSIPHSLDVLIQIPAGSMPVLSTRPISSRHLLLSPHGTETIEYAFYFPEPGTYDHYPVQVSQNEEHIAATEPRSLTVVATLQEGDPTSWAYISQSGSESALLAFLDTQNLERIDLHRIAWRMRDIDLYRRVLACLRERHVYSRLLWSYSVYHRDMEGMAELLRHEDAFLRSLGPAFQSSLITVDPVERAWYQHFEYAPLINARAHRLGGRLDIVNSGLKAHYQEFLQTLIYKPATTDEDRLAAAYYLFLQDRVAEGLAMLGRVRREQISAVMQYDYARAYAALYRGDLKEAKDAIQPYLDYPVDRWRQRFQAVAATVDQAGGMDAPHVIDLDDRDQAMRQLAATQEAIDLAVEQRRVTITYQNVRTCIVNYYVMDIELLFSRQPFMQEQADRFAVVKPNRRDTLDLPAASPSGSGEYSFDLPGAYKSTNLLIEVLAGGQRASKAYYANDLLVHVSDQYGETRVYQRSTKQPLPRAYVKVYARRRDGDIVFYKDGYTDMRGIFDYATLSTDTLDQVTRFAMLILSDEHGALIREVDPPKR